MEQQIVPEGGKSPKPAAPNACLPCRKVKMRCRPAGDGGKCERCRRKALDCVYRQHRRGRKLGTRLTRTASPALGGAPPVHAKGSEFLVRTPAQQGGPPPIEPVSEVARAAPGETMPGEQSSLQPCGLFSPAATQGRFSLNSVLSTADVDPADLSGQVASMPAEDPIRRGLVHLSVAESLFDNFINILNPYISQLDPVLHTFSFVQQRSTLLFSNILAAAAKSFNPALYPTLHDHAETLLAGSFRYGRKSTEVVQAIMINTYWKEPEDTRAWTSLGYAIRMCMDLGWHKLAPYSRLRQASMTEMQIREARNIERTWFTLFVYDRSISLQTGKPWMIERGAFMESIESWCRDPLATANDALLGAFVTLRLLSSEVFKLVGPKPRRGYGSWAYHSESFLAIIRGRIDEWESRWIASVHAESCHPFLIHFYATHIRLQLYSLPLQDILSMKRVDISSNLEILWVSYSSAMDMMNLTCRFAPRLYFVQDSIHIMTAYGAAFLIQLLMSAPDSIVSEIEQKTIDTIQAARQAFFQQSAPKGSSCALQAMFLDRIVRSYLEKKPSRERHREREPEPQLGDNPPQNGTDPNRAGMHPGAGSCQQRGPRPLSSRSAANEQPARATNQDLSPASMGEESTVAGTSRDGCDPYQSKLDMVASDEFSWADFCAVAGFNIQDGVFFEM